MIYAALLMAIPVLWFFPWWMVPVVGLVAGFFNGRGWLATILFSAGFGLAWAALAFIKDGQHAGLISRRVSGLFSLPHPLLIFAVIFVLGFITVSLTFQLGARIKARI